MPITLRIRAETAGANQEIDKFGSKIEKTLGNLKIKEAFGPAKELIGGLSGPLLGLDEQMKKTVDSTLNMAKAGGELGALAGPWGAAIGTLAGGALGLLADSLEEDARKAKEAEEAHLKHLKAVNDSIEALKEFRKYQATAEEFLKSLEVTSRDIGTVAVELARAQEEARGFAEQLVTVNTQFGINADLAAILKENFEGARDRAAALEKELDDLTKAAEKGTPKVKAIGEAAKKADEEFVPLGRTLDRSAGAITEIGDAATVSYKPVVQLGEAARSTNEMIYQAWAKAHPLTAALVEDAMQIGDAFGRVAAKGVDTLFDAIQNGERVKGRGLGEFTVKLLRDEGTQLIGQGAAAEAKALIMAFTPGLQANAAGLALAGAGAIGLGITLGGVGALVGRKASIRADGGGGSVGGGGGGFSGPTGGGGGGASQPSSMFFSVNVNGVPLGALSEREAYAIGGRVFEASRVFQRNGGARFLGEEH